MEAPATLPYTDDETANELLARDPLALLVGIVLYQQVPIEKAFGGPAELRRRLGGRLDIDAIAAMPLDELEETFRERPALHRFPAAMAKRVHGVVRHIADEFDGSVEALWKDAADADEVLSRLTDIPGFGEYKARIYLGVLAERFGIRPQGWEDHLPDWPSIVDVTEPADRAELKERKKAWKASGKRS